MRKEEGLILALPKGRILREVMPIVRRAGIEPEPAFDDPASRQLHFTTNRPGLSIICVRSFDVATFVAFGAVALGVAGQDVLMEFDYPEIYAPIDLKVGHCRLVVAEPAELVEADDPTRWSHIRVATKYPTVTRRHFAARGVQAECVKLSGAVELAPRLGLCRRIVDLVSTGQPEITVNPARSSRARPERGRREPPGAGLASAPSLRERAPESAPTEPGSVASSCGRADSGTTANRDRPPRVPRR